MEHDDDSITVGGHRIAVNAQRDPAAVNWRDLGVDVVIESTGRFGTREQAGQHLRAGTRKVLLSVPGKDVDATVVMGVNESTYDPERHDVVSNLLHHQLRRAHGEGAGRALPPRRALT